MPQWSAKGKGSTVNMAVDGAQSAYTEESYSSQGQCSKHLSKKEQRKAKKEAKVFPYTIIKQPSDPATVTCFLNRKMGPKMSAIHNKMKLVSQFTLTPVTLSLFSVYPSMTSGFNRVSQVIVCSSSGTVITGYLVYLLVTIFGPICYPSCTK